MITSNDSDDNEKRNKSDNNNNNNKNNNDDDNTEHATLIMKSKGKGIADYVLGKLMIRQHRMPNCIVRFHYHLL